MYLEEIQYTLQQQGTYPLNIHLLGYNSTRISKIIKFLAHMMIPNTAQNKDGNDHQKTVMEIFFKLLNNFTNMNKKKLTS